MKFKTSFLSKSLSRPIFSACLDEKVRRESVDEKHAIIHSRRVSRLIRVSRLRRDSRSYVNSANWIIIIAIKDIF